MNAEVNLADGTSSYYDIYLRNNVFDGATALLSTPAAGHMRAISNNGLWKAGTPQGTANVTGDPALDASYDVTSAAYVD